MGLRHGIKAFWSGYKYGWHDGLRAGFANGWEAASIRISSAEDADRVLSYARVVLRPWSRRRLPRILSSSVSPVPVYEEWEGKNES